MLLTVPVVDPSSHRAWVASLRAWRHAPWPAGRGRDRTKDLLTRRARPPRAVPTRAGWLALEHGEDSLERHLLATGTHWETQVVALLESASGRLRGATVVDVGGHVGFYALLLADLVGPEGTVVVVEAHDELCDRIRWAAERNRRHWVRVVHGAATGHEGPVTLGGDPDRGHTTAAESAHPGFTVPGLRLDDLLAELGTVDPQLVLMDIEGGEAAALRGAAGLLERAAPQLVVEVHPPQLAALGTPELELLSWLATIGPYDLTVLDHRSGPRPCDGPVALDSWHLVATRAAEGRPEIPLSP